MKFDKEAFNRGVDDVLLLKTLNGFQETRPLSLLLLVLLLAVLFDMVWSLL